MKTTPQLSRENHLNHLTNMAPLLCLAFSVQSYIFMSYSQAPHTGTIIFGVGLLLTCAIAALVMYDLNHKLEFEAEQFSIKWGKHPLRHFLYQEVKNIHYTNDENSFSHLTLEFYEHSPVKLYFVDNPEELKNYILTMQRQHFSAEAA